MSALPRSIRAQGELRDDLFRRKAAGHPFGPADCDRLRRLDEAFYHREWRKAQRQDPAAPGFDAATLRPTVIAEVAALRRKQAETYGHTPQADLEHSPERMAAMVRVVARDVVEDLQFAKPDLARRHLVKLIALAFAAIDRLDAERD